MPLSLHPRLLREIQSQAGTDPELAAVLAATAFVESGGDLVNDVGDNGHSLGPYQENDQGRGAGIPAADRHNPASSTRRAIAEFQRYRTGDPGLWAANAQRPADRAGYAQRIRSVYDQARQLIGAGAAPRSDGSSTGTQTVTEAQPQPQAAEAPQYSLGSQIARGLASRQPGQSLLKSVVSAVLNRQTAPTTPVATEASADVAPQPTAAPSPAVAAAERGDGRYPLGRRGNLIGQPYAGTHTIGNWQSDNAVDIGVPEGTPVYSVFDGTIGSRIGSLGSSSPRMAGLRLTVESADNAAYYAHLSRLAVSAGQRVRRGDLLGWSGTANGVGHLHLGLRSGDPRRLIGG